MVLFQRRYIFWNFGYLIIFAPLPTNLLKYKIEFQILRIFSLNPRPNSCNILGVLFSDIEIYFSESKEMSKDKVK